MYVISYRVGEVYQNKCEKTVSKCKDLYREGKDGTFEILSAYHGEVFEIFCHKDTANGV